MRVELRLRLRARRERGDRHKLARAPIDIVAREDVAEEMRLEVLIQLRMEVEERPLHRSAAELRLVRRADRQSAFAQRAARHVRCGTFRRLDFVRNLHERSRRVERAREAAVGVELPDKFLGLVERKPRAESRLERRAEFILLAARRPRTNIGDRSFLRRQFRRAGHYRTCHCDSSYDEFIHCIYLYCCGITAA